jgi:hypothetical protein
VVSRRVFQLAYGANPRDLLRKSASDLAVVWLQSSAQTSFKKRVPNGEIISPPSGYTCRQ